MDEEARRKPRETNMSETLEALDLQETDRTCMSMPLDERVRMMADHAREAKRSSGVKRLAQRARLRLPAAEPGEMIYEGRGIDGAPVREALTCQFMDRAADAIVEGCTGTGKSHLACCMAKQACRMDRVGNVGVGGRASGLRRRPKQNGHRPRIRNRDKSDS